ncbi:MAG: hypothetical protein MZW92_52815 [Comamonadaceae bacterium]|nr:hypothetical protein [Comamonadaceae bacterium]
MGRHLPEPGARPDDANQGQSDPEPGASDDPTRLHEPDHSRHVQRRRRMHHQEPRARLDCRHGATASTASAAAQPESAAPSTRGPANASPASTSGGT